MDVENLKNQQRNLREKKKYHPRQDKKRIWDEKTKERLHLSLVMDEKIVYYYSLENM